MKVAIIGGLGNMGRRYAAVCRYLGCEVVKVDLGYVVSDDFDRAIIATPTEDHASRLISMQPIIKPLRRPVLCEKPVVRTLDDLDRIKSLYEGLPLSMVCNWKYAINSVASRHGQPVVMEKCKIEYDCYNTGKDGIHWDCIQLRHIAGDLTVNYKSPVMECFVDGMQVTTRDIEESYVLMVSDWLNGGNLWGMEDIEASTKKVLKWITRAD